MHKINLWNRFKSYFPSTKAKWKLYSKVAIPVVFSSILFAFNGFVDNFMVTEIDGGVASLNFANTWTGIIFGFLLGGGFISAVLFGQYYGKKDYAMLRKVNNARYLISIFITNIFVIAVSINPTFFITLVAKDEGAINGEPSSQYLAIVENGVSYLRIIAISWFLMGLTYPTSNILREAGYGAFSFYITLASLLTNIGLNLLLIPSLGVEGAAWASAASRIVILSGNFIFIYIKDKKLLINFFKIFQVSKEVWMQFVKRLPSFVFTSLGIVFVSIRSFLWANGYGIGSLGIGEYKQYWGLGAAAIMGITSAMTNIFTAAFPSAQSNVSLFVGSELGKGNFEQAKINAKELKGFHVIVSSSISLIFGIAIFFVPYFTFFSSGIENGVENAMQGGNFSQEIIDIQKVEAGKFYLKQIQFTVIWVALFNPLWMYFITSLRVVASGGKNNLVSYLEFGAGVIQILWLIIIVYAIIPFVKNIDPSWEFPLFFFIFFCSDFIKLIVYDWAFFKIKWATNITENK